LKYSIIYFVLCMQGSCRNVTLGLGSQFSPAIVDWSQTNTRCVEFVNRLYSAETPESLHALELEIVVSMRKDVEMSRSMER
jgi:hypothetical protein